MENFSIESAIDRISDPRSKEYFQEVNSSYRNGNYRSAVVMLWTTVVCDLIYKLQTLRDIHNDPTRRKLAARPPKRIGRASRKKRSRGISRFIICAT